MRLNPFAVSSPESMNAEELTRLFVPLSESYEIDSIGHVFIHGHRGCGKSMLLRQMSPDCLMISNQSKLSDLPYIAIYSTIKHTDLDLADFERINDDYAGLILAEHALALFVASKTFQSLVDHTNSILWSDDTKTQFENLVNDFVIKPLNANGAKIKYKTDFVSTRSILEFAIGVIDSIYSELMSYLRRIGINSEKNYIPYSGTIIGYRDFLYPLLCQITQLGCMPKNAPVFVMLDDADNLSNLQTQVLNTWVSFRTSHKVSFKISTQKCYKTWRTINHQLIEPPHDFREVDISTIYTGGQSTPKYPQWVSSIVSKRLQENNINVTVDEFFPPDAKQEEAIKAIAKSLTDRWDDNGKGYRPSDDAYRYARPDYIRSLAAKQLNKYSYAGFTQLVHISSGIIRYFLDNAATMYAEQLKLQKVENNGPPTQIPTSIQDDVVRQSADDLMFGTLDKLVADANGGYSKNHSASEFEQLRNLILALGGIFQLILLSDRSERRVFSIALSDSPPKEIMAILDLGVIHGYLYESAIGTKDGRGRTRRYVLTRRLAPFFKLDPTGFSGYLFVTTSLLNTAITNPTQAINEFKSNRLGTVIEEAQLNLAF